MGLKDIYEHSYKKLLIIPFLLLLLSLVQIGIQYAQTGDFVNKGVSLKGGSTITFEGTANTAQLQETLTIHFPRSDISVRAISSAGTVVGIIIESDAQAEEEIASLLSVLESEVGDKEFSVEAMGASLGSSFFRQIITALVVAFVLMGAVVFLYFRSIAPSMAVILAAFSDIVVTLAVFNLTGIRLSTAGIAAFLMLIGYSVDTDIVLSTRVLKRQELPLMERIYSAMKTGLTMSATTLSAILVALFLVQSDVVKQIMIILFIGLLVDLVMTYIQNAGLLRLYVERGRK